MLSRKNRFHGHGGVRRVYRLGKPTRTNFASLHVLQNERVYKSKVAVVVSRKVDKSAVKRNRIRRRLYALMQSELPKLKTPTELVLTVYQAEVATMPAMELEKAFLELMQKAKP
jgi:ribonuclease P protein component